jgi:hypothetical protein
MGGCTEKEGKAAGKHKTVQAVQHGSILSSSADPTSMRLAGGARKRPAAPAIASGRVFCRWSDKQHSQVSPIAGKAEQANDPPNHARLPEQQQCCR